MWKAWWFSGWWLIEEQGSETRNKLTLKCLPNHSLLSQPQLTPAQRVTWRKCGTDRRERISHSYWVEISKSVLAVIKMERFRIGAQSTILPEKQKIFWRKYFCVWLHQLSQDSSSRRLLVLLIRSISVREPANATEGLLWTALIISHLYQHQLCFVWI